MQSYELFAERNRVLAVFFKELRIKPKIDHYISILVSVCSEQVAAGAPKAMAGYGETQREAKVWAMQSPQT